MSSRRMGTRLVGVAAVLAVALAVAVTFRGQTGRASEATPMFQIGSARGASFVPAVRRGRPLFILALGSDARRGQVVDRERADSIHIIGVDVARRRATILGFPRDAYVDIPGNGKARMNNALEVGGPQLVVQTLESLTGIPIDFWMLTSFPGLTRMVDGIGGLTIDVPREMHDPFSGADFSPGIQHLDGKQVLAFTRDRHDLPNGDFDRSENHGRVLLATLAKLRRTFSEDPAALLTWLAIGWRHLSTDLAPATLLDLALTATQIPTRNVNNIVVPGEPTVVGTASVVTLSPKAPVLYADMRADGFVDRPPPPP